MNDDNDPIGDHVGLSNTRLRKKADWIATELKNIKHVSMTLQEIGSQAVAECVVELVAREATGRARARGDLDAERAKRQKRTWEAMNNEPNPGPDDKAERATEAIARSYPMGTTALQGALARLEANVKDLDSAGLEAIQRFSIQLNRIDAELTQLEERDNKLQRRVEKLEGKS